MAGLHMIKVHSSWKDFFSQKDVLQELSTILEKIGGAPAATQPFFPPKDLIFNVFLLCPLTSIRVVILGQDPYIQHGQAHGIAFSVPQSIPAPPSLKNIYKELEADTGIQNTSGDLTSWVKQGVFLLNTALTVFPGEPNSHTVIWRSFTDKVISHISATSPTKIVFLLWGNNAISKASLIDQKKHLILTAAHPSPLSAFRGFFGCKHFSKVNLVLKSMNMPPIKWEVSTASAMSETNGASKASAMSGTSEKIISPA